MLHDAERLRRERLPVSALLIYDLVDESALLGWPQDLWERRESDALAETPKVRPISHQDVLATMYHQLGINFKKTYYNEANRPVEILNNGTPIREVIA